MKNKFKLLFVLLAAVACFSFAIACKEVPPPHEHTFEAELSYDSTHHWYAASCEHTEEQKDKAEHTLTESVITAPTYTAVGSAKEVCACGYETAPYELSKLPKEMPIYTVATRLVGTV